MSDSLRDQLVKAGLADEAQLRRVRSEQHRQRKRKKRKSQRDDGNAAAPLAARAQAEKREQDRRLNEERDRERDRRHAAAALRQQLAAANLTIDGDIAHHFTVGSRIKRVYVNKGQHEALAAGKLAIGVYDERSYVLAPDTARRLADQHPELTVVIAGPAAGAEGRDEDPYADFPVPDDLVW